VAGARDDRGIIASRKMMPTLILTLAASLALLAGSGQGESLWWVFLNKGPNRDQPEADLKKMQEEHLANLGRLWKEGKSPLAGPLGDDGFTRGIVVVKAASREAVTGYFAPDPFVRVGRLTVEAYPWSGRAESFGAAKEPVKLVQATLAVVKKGPRWVAGAADLAAAHGAHLRRLEADGTLALSGALTDAGDKLEVLMLRTADAKEADALFAGDPAVRAGHLAVELHPQYLADGILGIHP
jgi:uncharacterized protein YciI